MRLATPQFTPFTLCDDPTPRMAEDITCVVLTGICRMVAPNMTNAPVKSPAPASTALYSSSVLRGDSTRFTCCRLFLVSHLPGSVLTADRSVLILLGSVLFGGSSV